MKKQKTSPQYSILNVKGLIFIYILLCILTIFFTRSFFSDILYSADEGKGNVPSGFSLVMFLTVPAVLLVFLGIAAFNMLGDIISRRPGSKFKARLLGYFIIIVVFAAAPLTLLSGISINEIVNYWHQINTAAAEKAAKEFAVENLWFHEKNFWSIIENTDWDAALSSPLPEGIDSVQDFQQHTGEEILFYGNENSRLESLPTETEGSVPLINAMLIRKQPRDNGLIRYVTYPSNDVIRLINYNLGHEFDNGMAAIENQSEGFDVINTLQENQQILVFFYFGVFFFPTLLMTLIIAISFTRRVTNPIVELTEATRRVAEGDFSIQILARRGDELGLLIRSFNAMVQDLEKSRTALVKAEKLSIWQNMSQQLAHEIKNPLTPIKLSAERVLRRWRNNPEQINEIIEDSMLAIIQETEGLSTLLNEFKTLSKPMEPSKTWTILGTTVEEIITMYRSSYPNIEFIINHKSPEVTLKIDKHRFSQAMTNILLNAVDSMGSSGTIAIRTDLVKKREMWYCRLSINDSGKGITKQESTMIFTPYFTTKDSGTGLGLPIVERIINDHGGAIWFNSGEGKGTTFYIDLPISEEK